MSGAFLDAAAGESAVRTVHGDFEECRDALLDEVAARGIVLTYRAHVADMLARTADVTGAARIYRNAEIVGFCKVDVSARMLAADPHNIVYCPQSVIVYELETEPGVIRMAYRKAAAPGAAAAESLQADIIRDACE